MKATGTAEDPGAEPAEEMLAIPQPVKATGSSAVGSSRTAEATVTTGGE
jgi:hypothetical protein